MSRYHLPARPIAVIGESPASVLIRAVEGNGYDNLSMLLRAYWDKENLSWAKAAFTDTARYTEIMEAFGIRPPEEGQLHFLRRGATSESARWMDGMVVPEKLFREDARYYCPECLKEKAYWRKHWMVKPYSVCPNHRVYLKRDCPTCGNILGINRGRLAVCDCGEDLGSLLGEIADPGALEWWLAVHQHDPDKARNVDEILLALEKIEGGNEPKSEYRRLSAVYEWVEFGQIATWLTLLIERQAAELHPRIQFLPLLRCNSREAWGLAKAILSHWHPVVPLKVAGDCSHLIRHDAELALGISPVQFNRFEKHYLLEFPDGRQRERGKVSLYAVNRLLFAMQAEQGEKHDIEGRGLTTSLASMVVEVMSGTRKSAGYDVAAGLKTLLLKKCQDITICGPQIEDWIDVNETAELLGTYPEAVRFLCKKVWMASKRGANNRLLVQRKEAETFNSKYILGGTFAAKIGENPTNASEKLMALGLKPAAGPSLDGSLVYVFRRTDVERVDIEKLRSLKNYPTKAGRKPKDNNAGRVMTEPDQIPSTEAAIILGVEPYEVLKLIRRKILERLNRLERDVYVSKSAVKQLQGKLIDDKMISVEGAARRLGLSVKAMEGKWTRTGVLEIYNFGLWRKIKLSDLETLEGLLVTHVPAKEAGELLSTHRSYLPNLERQGAINSERIGKNGAIRLYALADLRKLNIEL